MLHKIAVIGFGTVGQAFLRVLHEKGDWLRERYGLEYRIVGISDIQKGSVMDPNGLDAGRLLSLVLEKGKIDEYPKGVKDLNAVDTIRRSNPSVVVEAAWTNLNTGEPGLSHIREALKLRKHVITSNKGPIALAYKELKTLAEEKQVELRFECTVMSGTPVISVGLDGLAGHHIEAVKGVLNGTTNFILTKMEEGKSYSEALAEAQRLRYAEVDPSADVEGWDAVGKIVILANVLMGAGIKPSMVARRGITRVSMAEIEEARKDGCRIKLVAHAWREGDGIKAKVSPERVALSDPLATVSGGVNAVTFSTDGLGDVTVIGKGAGGTETGHGILTDLLSIDRSLKRL